MATDYTRRDFNTIKDDLLRRATSVVPEWTDRDPSDFGMLFVDLWAYMGDVLNYYVDRATREAFLTTATQRESVLAIANLMDYRPAGRTAAQSSVTITNVDGSNTVVVPIYTRFTGVDGTTTVNCYTIEEVTIPPSSSITVIVAEGTYYAPEQRGSALGTSSQTININTINVISNSVRVFVREDDDGTPNTGYRETDTEYRFVNSLSEAEYGEKVYTLYTDASGITSITFGNNINGFIPPVNSPIFVSYSTSSGSSGNYGANTVTTFVSGSVFTSLQSITGSTSFIGGVNEESIDSMRTAIPRATRSQNRAVTLEDFIDVTLGIPGVYKAAATYASGSVTVYPVVGQASYTTSTAASIPITSEVSEVVLDTLEPKALLGVTVRVAANVPLVGINISANVYVNERYTASWVSNDVQKAITDLFLFENVKFNQRIALSELYHTIIGVEGVDYANITVFSTTSSGISQSIQSGATSLFRKGTINIDSYGGVSTAVVPGG